MAIEAGTKFLGIASSVDTKERRSKALNDKSEYHTIEDIAAAATAGIAFPDPVDADTIVVQLDAENYTTIESNLSGKLPYELTRVNIPSFKTDTTSAGGVIYSSEGVSLSGLVTFDTASFAYKMTLDTSFPLTAYVTCRIKGYGTGATLPPLLVAGQVSSAAGTEILLIVYDTSGNSVTNATSPALQFGLEVDIIKY
jgi:hypothetical protein